MRIWGFVFVITLIFNTFWGWFMDRYGWVWPMRWFGCAVLAVGSVAFYYIPQWFGANAVMMIIASIIVGIGTCAFSSLPTIMTLYVVPLLYDLLFKKPPLNIDVGSDDLGDIPDDAAEYIAQNAAQPE